MAYKLKKSKKLKEKKAKRIPYKFEIKRKYITKDRMINLGKGTSILMVSPKEIKM